MLFKPRGFKTLAITASSQLLELIKRGNVNKGKLYQQNLKVLCLLKIITYVLFIISLISFILIAGFFFPLLALSVWTEKEKVQ